MREAGLGSAQYFASIRLAKEANAADPDGDRAGLPLVLRRRPAAAPAPAAGNGKCMCAMQMLAGMADETDGRGAAP